MIVPKPEVNQTNVTRPLRRQAARDEHVTAVANDETETDDDTTVDEETETDTGVIVDVETDAVGTIAENDDGPNDDGPNDDGLSM